MADEMIGKVLRDQYRIDAPLGSGGIGVVYRGRQLSLDRDVAIKILKVDRNEENTKRFLREAKLLSHIAHPNIVQVVDFGATEEGIFYLVMELLPGETLKECVQRTNGLSYEKILNILEQLCHGLNAAHQSSVVHRDLKPLNVMLTPLKGGEELVKLLDFGISRSAVQEDLQCTAEGMVLGSPSYISPEQIQSSTVIDPRSDIYALGALLYYMVTGRAPYSGDTLTGIFAKQLTEAPEPIVVSDLNDRGAAAFSVVIEKAMQLNPANRYQGVSELLAHAKELAPRGANSPSARINFFTKEILASPAARQKRVWPWLAGAAVAAVAVTMGFRSPTVSPKAENIATARGVSANKIQLGMSGPFTGPASELGKAMKLGVELGLQEANARGGIHGRELELVSLDDGYEPSEAKENALKLVEREQVFAVVGSVGTPTTLAALPQLLSTKTVLFGAYTGSERLRLNPPDRYVFNLRASYAEEIAALVRYFVRRENIPAQGIALVTQNDSFGDSGFYGARLALADYGVSESSILRIGVERNSVEVDDAVRSLMARGDIRAVIVVSAYATSARLTAALREAGSKVAIANLSFVDTEALRRQFVALGGVVADGVIVTEVVPRYDGYSTIASEYRTAMKRFAPKERADATSFEGYLVARIFLAGVERAGPNLTPETLVEGFESISNLDLGTGSPIRFSKSDHQASDKVWAVRFDKDANYLPLELD